MWSHLFEIHLEVAQPLREIEGQLRVQGEERRIHSSANAHNLKSGGVRALGGQGGGAARAWAAAAAGAACSMN
jgi:hypothetical protein